MLVLRARRLWDPPGALTGRLASWWFLERVCSKKRNAAVCENQRAGRGKGFCLIFGSGPISTVWMRRLRSDALNFSFFGKSLDVVNI